jgi:RNA polymerase sigma-70 factor, ECF subfamily
VEASLGEKQVRGRRRCLIHPSERRIPDDDQGMSEGAAAANEQGEALLTLYDEALPDVFGYLVRRCPTSVAEELTADTFLAAVSAVRRGTVDRLTVAWLMTVARNKLVDHWRRVAREERSRHLVVAPQPPPDDEDWVEGLDPSRALTVLAGMGAHHQAALTLRYLDGLSVPEVADRLERTVHATEALLVRARSAFRRAYGERGDDDA